MTSTDQFDLVRAELEELVDQVIDPEATEPFGTYVFGSSEPGAELGRAVEREVFGEFFGNSPELLAEEYASYDDASVFFVVIDHRRRVPAGVIRVIVPSEAGQKSLDDLERVWGEDRDEVITRSKIDFDPDRAWDVATLAVSKDYRGEKTNSLISLALFQALGMATVASQVAWWVAILDVVVLDLVQSAFSRPVGFFRGVGPMRYLDSVSSVPVCGNVAAWEERIRVTDPAMHDLLVNGVGLEGAVCRPNWDRLPELVPTASVAAAG